MKAKTSSFDLATTHEQKGPRYTRIYTSFGRASKNISNNLRDNAYINDDDMNAKTLSFDLTTAPERKGPRYTRTYKGVEKSPQE